MMSLPIIALFTCPAAVFVADREPVLVVVLGAESAIFRLGTSEVMRSLSAVVLERTDFDPLGPERAGVDTDRFNRCGHEERTACWAAAAREAEVRFRAAFVVNLAPAGPNKDRVAVTFLNLDNDLSATALPAEVASEDTKKLDLYFAEAVQSRFRDLLEESGHLDPFGEMELARAPIGAAIVFDGKEAGTFTSTSVVLRGVRPGVHTVEVSDALEKRRCQGEVKRGFRAVFNLPLCEKTAGADPEIRRTTETIAGLSIAGAGAAALIFAFAESKSAPRVVCIAKDPAAADRCQSFGNVSFAYSTGDLPRADVGAVERGLIKPGPLGTGLILAGATLFAGARFFDEDPWWLPILLSAGAGIAGYAVTALAGH